MRLSEFGRQLDESVLGASAALARRLDRRQLLRGVLGGSALAAAGLSAGSVATLLNAREAEAHLNHCGGWFHIHGNTKSGSPQCSGCPGLQTTTGCPTGFTTCPSSTGCRNCTYSNGQWVAQNGLGMCGAGFKICYDCHQGSSCTVCTCLSPVLCSGCCSAEDVQASMRYQSLIPVGD